MVLKSRSDRVDLIKILLAVVVVLTALAVRVPSLFLIGIQKEYEDTFVDDSGLPYFTDPDSYYHIRLVDTMLKTGKIADTISSEGEPWDTHSYYPEGRSAVYQPGIIYLTIGLWKLFNLSVPLDISRVEFYMSGLMATLTALVAYITGCHINGKVSGLVAGIITGCSPAFVYRSVFGRFDTDIFVVFMNVLLILFITEMLRISELKYQIAFAILYIVTALIYANCWAPKISLLFVGLSLLGGLIYSVINNRYSYNDKEIKRGLVSLFMGRQIALVTGVGILILLIICISMGSSVVGDIFRVLSFKTTQDVSDSILPNMYQSIAELERPTFAPENFLNWFRAYNPNSEQTVITGVGGAFAVVAAVGGLIILCLKSVKRLNANRDGLPTEKASLLYFVELTLWTIVGLFLSFSGIRFIEILITPVGILAGIFAGWLAYRSRADGIKIRVVKAIVSLVVVGVIVLPDYEGVLLGIRMPSVTDASANAMKWIEKNSDDPKAVVASWWDMGYFYESESGHPCIWDGGSQNPARAILFARAMTENDMEMSYRILNMMTCSGNKAIDMLMEHTDPRTSFEILWEVLPMDSKKARNTIISKCGMSAQEARKIEEFIHPKENHEAYLVLTYTMAQQTAVYEYYSDWNFTGTQISPYSSEYSEYDVPLTEEEMYKLNTKRERCVMWRLFFDLEDNNYFTPGFECNDGIEAVKVWKINQTKSNKTNQAALERNTR